MQRLMVLARYPWPFLDMAERNPPAEDELHWMTVQELWMKKDKEQCESWKDEVGNVLIFSGLFSAIVTAFVIVAQGALQVDPSVQLLMQIATQTAGKEWVEPGPPALNHANICVNVFWFLSLVFSLTAALVGIVALQWIRTHMRSLRGGPDTLGISHIHSRGLHQSYIPLIFTSLSVILIAGLLFFFIGLIVFLFQLGWRVALPVTIGIALPLAFLVTTTAHPGFQRLPSPNNRPDGFPSPYRSAQSFLFLQSVTLLKRLWSNDRSPGGQHNSDSSGSRKLGGTSLTNLESGQSVEAKPVANDNTDDCVSLKGRFDWTEDWTSRTLLWLRQRESYFAEDTRPLTHLKSKRDSKPKLFPYDTIQALASVKESRSAESENERAGLAKCLAEVLPSHLDCFPTGDLADLIPCLPSSKFVPSGVFIRENSATREELSAFALLQVATCNGQPSESVALIKACVVATGWLFERPRTFDSVPGSQPLHLISDLEPDTDALYVHDGLMDTLTRFFTFATDFQPESQNLNRTTFTSSYIYWFLVLSAKILTKHQLPSKMQDRHTYILALIAASLDDKGKKRDYLFLTASIYASNIISGSSEMCSKEVGVKFLRAVREYRGRFKPNPECKRLCGAVNADEVLWDEIDEALRSLDAVSGDSS